MKIAVISSSVFPAPPAGYAGLEMIAYQVAKGLAAKGHQVTLIAPEGSSCPGGEVFVTGPAGQWGEDQHYSKYWQELLRQDVIIDHSWGKFSYLLKGEGRLKAPVLGVLHAPVKTMYQSLPPNVDKPCFVCISDDQRAQFEQIHERPARTAHNGIDMDIYKPITGVRRTNRFLFLARFSSIKGADLAISACKSVGVGLDLIGDTSITGEPDYYRQCCNMADAVPGQSMPDKSSEAYARRIEILGGVKRGEAVWWYSQAHCFLHPNMRFREPLGLAPLEAQACGLPVVAWNYGAMRETVRIPMGVLVNSMDEFAGAIRNMAGGISNEKREACRQWVGDNFTEQRMVDRYDELCREAVDTGGW